jgi:hypothetical protein
LSARSTRAGIDWLVHLIGVAISTFARVPSDADLLRIV